MKWSCFYNWEYAKWCRLSPSRIAFRYFWRSSQSRRESVQCYFCVSNPGAHPPAPFFWKMDHKRKIDFAIKLLRNIPQDGPIEVSYSGGKDSDVILELAKMAGIPFEAIYKNTTIDPPGTIKHCKDNGVTIVKPKMSFLQLVEKYGMPTRWTRFCCAYLKEYKIYDRNIIGIRKSESTRPD